MQEMIVFFRIFIQSCYAGVSSDRTNLSPFTKDYRGLALPCELRVFAARKGAKTKVQSKI